MSRRRPYPVDAPAFELLWPSLQRADAFRCVELDGRLAVIVLGPHCFADLSDVAVAVRLHVRLGRGLLVVF